MTVPGGQVVVRVGPMTIVAVGHGPRLRRGPCADPFGGNVERCAEGLDAVYVISGEFVQQYEGWASFGSRRNGLARGRC